ncbi:glycosyltransferase [Morganella psychrotolerans]|uniref:glycosyltransferase n=1 Tax=Morganella psychrotolerans TaxID=368603 RepID=UPI0039AF57F9
MSNKIIYISPYLDTDTSFGGSVVSWSNLEKLKLSSNIISIAISRKSNNRCDYSVHASKNKITTAFNNLLGFSGRLSFNTIKEILIIIDKEKPALIYLDSSYLGKLAKLINNKYPDVKIITFFHNIEYDFEINRLRKNQLQYIPSFWSAWLNERSAIKYSNKLFMLHKSDSDRARKLYKRSADFLLPVTLPSHIGEEYNNISFSELTPRNIGFFGTAFYANVEAAKYISKILSPLLPEYNFIIAGNGFEKYTSDLSNENVSILGTVNSITEFYNSVDIIIAPVFSGGGMKVKIAEALSYNKLTIGSPFALIGYENVIDNKNLFSADTTEDFINLIKNVAYLDNPRKLFIDYFSNESVSKQMIDEIEKELI